MSGYNQPRRNFSGSSRGRGGQNNFFRSDRNQSNQSSDDATIITVPSRFVGRIIGRGGSKIAELQTQTGARIMVTKDENDGETTVKLIGSESAIADAKSRIEELTVDRERPARNYNQYSNAEEDSWDQPSERPARNYNHNSNNADDEEESYQDKVAREIREEMYKKKEEKKYIVEEPREIIDWQKLNEEHDRYQAEKLAKMEKIVKHFYVELPEVRDMSKEEVKQFRLMSNKITVARTITGEKASGKPIPNPVSTFYQAFHNYPEIMEEIRKQGFEKPSPIQCQAWPVLMTGEDLIGIAQTGTGKTLAFLLPALLHIHGQPEPPGGKKGPQVLILAPTRELALQIEREVRKYYYKGIKSVCLYGGGDRKAQIKALKEGVDIVIATPGRLNDLVTANHVNVEQVTFAVLDEADRMLDMGFEPQIRKVMYDVRKDRQTCMTSATWPSGVRRLAESYMEDPIQIYVGSLELAAVHSVTQTIVFMERDDYDAKFNELLQFCLNMQPGQKVIVFCGKKLTADDIGSELATKGVDYQILHGSCEQPDREQALKDIMDGTVNILITTDVASRGLDIDDLTHVINYDFPRNIEEYVHRVGRTGRAGRTGDSISYFTRGDWAQAQELIDILEEADQYVPQELIDMSKRYQAWKQRKEESGGGFRGRKPRW